MRPAGVSIHERGAESCGEMAHGAQGMLVWMGDEDRLEPFAVGFQPREIGEDQIDTGAGVHVREGHPEIDEDQPLAPRLAVAIDIGIHAHLARAAERQVDQPVAAHRVASSLLLYA